MQGRPYVWTLALVAAVLTSGGARAEDGGGSASGSSIKPLTVTAAVTRAVGSFPASRASAARYRAAGARAEERKVALAPDVIVSAMLERATGNVVPGSFFSQPGIPTTSGPVRGRSLEDSASGSAAAVSVRWDALGLLREIAAVDAALADANRARAEIDSVRLDVGFITADRFIDVLERQDLIAVARANVARAQALVSTVRALADQQLRPGADLSRALAERALAETDLARQEQAADVTRARLAEMLGVGADQFMAVSSGLDGLPPTTGGALAPARGRDPRLVASQSAVDASEKGRRVAELEYLPRLAIVGALWARGSGFYPGGANLGSAQGLVPDTPNWAAGIVLEWSALSPIATRARVKAAWGALEEAQARHHELELAIGEQLASAQATLNGAVKVAESAPAAVAAARDGERQANARYRSGLAGVVEVAEAQRILARAEAEDTVSRIEVWRALLLLARARGDLQPFLAAAGGK